MTKVSQLFNTDDAKVILSIPLSPSLRYRLIWHFDNRDMYMVMSDYFVASNLNCT